MTNPRVRMWELLAGALGGALDDDELEVLRGLPAVQDVPADADALAERHIAVFAFDVWPWASAWLSDDGLVGGPVRGLAAQVVHRAGPAVGSEPDGLSDLCFALSEVDDDLAWRQALGNRLALTWWPSLQVALARSGANFEASCVEAAIGLLLDHPVADDGLHLGEPIHRWDGMLIPARAGWFPTRSAMRRWGAVLGVPTGTGARSEVWRDLTEGVGVRGLGDDLVGLLEVELDAVDLGLAAWASAGAPVAAWRAQLGHTRRWLSTQRSGS